MPTATRVAFFIALIIMHIFIYFVLFKNISTNPIIRHIGKLLVVSNFLCIVIFLKMYHTNLNAFLYTILSSSLGIMWISFNVAVVTYIIMMCVRFGLSAFTLYKYETMIILIAWCSIIILTLLSFYINAKQPIVVEEDITIHNLKQPLNIAFLADTHIDVLMDAQKVAQIVEQTNNLKPDIIILGGDIFDNYYHIIQDSLQEIGKLRAKYGVYYILGNHEYYYDTYTILQALNKLGITTLVNKNMILRNIGLNIAGIADFAGQKEAFKTSILAPNLAKTLESRDTRFPTILLSHQPKIIKSLHTENVELVLSGHTHGGQIFPFQFIVSLEQPFLHGLHDFEHDNLHSQIYITKGAGWWGMPMRLFSTREISLLHLLPANYSK